MQAWRVWLARAVVQLAGGSGLSAVCSITYHRGALAHYVSIMVPCLQCVASMSRTAGMRPPAHGLPMPCICPQRYLSLSCPACPCSPRGDDLDTRLLRAMVVKGMLEQITTSTVRCAALRWAGRAGQGRVQGVLLGRTLGGLLGSAAALPRSTLCLPALSC